MRGSSRTILLKLRSRRVNYDSLNTSGSTTSKFICERCKLLLRAAVTRRVFTSLCYALDLLVASSLFGLKSAVIISNLIII